MNKLAVTLCAFAFSAPLALMASPKADPVAMALASPTRPEADKARDRARKPAELIAFAGIKPGHKVVDFVMGGGYLTRVIAGTVGPKGVVYAFQPAEFVGFRAQYAVDQDNVAKALPNVKPLRAPFATPAIPEPVDVIVTVQNYHDLYLAPFPADTADKATAALFKALKPGGTLVVVDHVAATGSGRAAPDKLHRIDPAFARAEIEKAGFKFDGELKAWRQAADPHTDNVFTPAIRGKTDQFAYRFRKPL
ncbi:MAG: class I SAM-dependent methyltransferase [Sphingomonas sp.]